MYKLPMKRALVLAVSTSRPYLGLNARVEGTAGKLRYAEVIKANHVDAAAPAATEKISVTPATMAIPNWRDGAYSAAA